ncbi:MAG: hypothetical protein KAR11_08295 [Phycisphaerae bacterium]|nr:hypothetical protein [Phycisphaerae bacterium]
MRFCYIFIVTLVLAGIFCGCINIDANTKVDGADKYSAIGEKYADKYAGDESSDSKDDDD